MAAKIDHNDLITCPICFEQFTNPKLLPCLHTFCHPCLKAYIITHLGGEGKKGQDFPCPVCRQVVNITDKTLSSEMIADTIPGNRMIASLMERSRGTDNGQKGKLCGPCNRDNKDLTATFWCTLCLETLCENCTTYHKLLDQSRHVLIPVEKIVEKLDSKVLDVEEPCMKHTGEFLKVYCEDHKEMCCVICLATSHRKCEHISTLEEMVNSSKETDAFDNFNSKLSEMDKKSDELRIKFEENLNNLNTKHGELTQNVSSTIQKAKDRLDNLQTKFEQKFNQIHKEECVKVTERKDRIEIFQNSVKRGQKLLQAVREHGSPKQMFITKEKIKHQLKDHVRSLGEELRDVKCVDYTMKLDSTVASVAQCLDSVAEVDIKSDLDLTENLKYIFNTMNSMCDIEEMDAAATMSQNPVNVQELEVSKLQDITTQNEELVGGTYLPDRRLVLCNYTGCKLILYDANGKLLFEQKLIQRPTDACFLTDNEIAVAFGERNYIIKYKVKQDAFIEMCEIKCKGGPWGLAATKDTIIVGYARKIDVLSFDGVFIKTLSTRKGERLSYITVSPTGNVYYSDGDIVMCKSRTGTQLARYNHPHLQRVFGIAFDKHGFVYACGYGSKNLVAFSPDGSKSKILLENLESPYTIIFDTKRELFFFANGRHISGLYKCSFTS